FLNRAPTLHRLGIQSFFPKLVEGHAIRVHPLVCPAFNADFDGDQMAVHLPLSEMARAETEVLMLGANNILGPKDGKPIVTPGQDLVLGNFYLNMEETAQEFYSKADALEKLGLPNEAAKWRRYGDNEGHVFKNPDEVIMAYQVGEVHLHSRIALPGYTLKKDDFSKKMNESYLLTTVGKVIFNGVFPADFPYMNIFTPEAMKTTLDVDFVPMGTDIKKEFASRKIQPEFKKKDLGNLIAAVFERYKTNGTSDILDSLKDMGYLYSTLAGMTVALSDISVAPHKQEMINEGMKRADQYNALRDRGLLTPQEWERAFSQLWDEVKNHVGDMLMASLPRMNPINMMAVSGARGNKNHFTQLAGMRGLMARPTQSKSRKDYQPSIIEVPIYSCFREGMSVSEFFISTHGVRKGLTDTALKTSESGYLTRRLVDVAHEVIVNEDDCGTDKGYLVSELRDENDNSVIENFFDRIVGRYTQQAITDPKTGEVIVDENSYITDELANKAGDITQGLPRVEELFEARTPKRVTVIAKIDGEITDIETSSTGAVITVTGEKESIEHKCDLTQPPLAGAKVGTRVTAGQPMTEGQIAPKELLGVAGVKAVEEYILKEVKKVYSAQSIDISDKHLEVMIRQMLRKVILTDGGDSGMSEGQTMSIAKANELNSELLDEGKTPTQFNPILLGISKAAVETDSFLSATSFQETTRVLTDAAVKGKVDNLSGLKENVIIGKLIPAGTGRSCFDRETTRRIIAKAAELKEERRERNAAYEAATAIRLPDEIARAEAEAEEAKLDEAARLKAEASKNAPDDSDSGRE
ncbi:MAG: DNA-directed RNA polymerase subunit beta', partial [Erysipelotrichia bacterium]|nr:DNA-directed RNA polymerase subunit beta' [Erysipelotrichia bacterium]